MRRIWLVALAVIAAQSLLLPAPAQAAQQTIDGPSCSASTPIIPNSCTVEITCPTGPQYEFCGVQGTVNVASMPLSAAVAGNVALDRGAGFETGPPNANSCTGSGSCTATAPSSGGFAPPAVGNTVRVRCSSEGSLGVVSVETTCTTRVLTSDTVAPTTIPGPTNDPTPTLDLIPIHDPVLGKSFNVEPTAGEVYVSDAPTIARASQSVPGVKGRTFVPLREKRQIAMGSLLDTRRGRVRITTARNRSGRLQSGSFSSGVFQVLQSRDRRARGFAELRLKGSSFSSCRTRLVGKGANRAGAPAQLAGHRRLSRRVVRRVRSRATGRFRSRGRYSSATVRGTAWDTVDRCDGTLTRVSRGVVSVRDVRRKRTIRVRAGKSYLARAAVSHGAGRRGTSCRTRSPGLPRIIGSGGADRITGTGVSDGIFALAGNDHVSGGGGNDCVEGGTGHDVLDGSNGNDVLIGGPGGDSMQGGFGHDLLIGGSGDDGIHTGNGRDRVLAGAGDDIINAATSGPPARVDCGPGRDRVRINNNERHRIRHCEIVDVFFRSRSR